MKWLFRISVFWGLLPLTSLVAGQPLTPHEAFKESDAIAYIKIDEVGPLGGDGKYAKTARAEVYEPIKGLKSNEVFNLDFDTGSSTANVLYSGHEKAVVILRRLANGHYETLHDYCGKFNIEEGDVLDCYLLGEPGKVPGSVPIDEVVRRFRLLVAQTTEE